MASKYGAYTYSAQVGRQVRSAEVELTIDLAGILADLGARALVAKGRRASAQGGMIRVQVVKGTEQLGQPIAIDVKLKDNEQWEDGDELPTVADRLEELRRRGGT